ncbi:MAG: glycosyltransferase family 61 protein [Bacteroidota bacterium]
MKLFKLKEIFKQNLKKGLAKTYRFFGYKFYNKDAAYDFLKERSIYRKISNPVKITKLVSFNGVTSAYFKEDRSIDFYPDQVWKVAPDKGKEVIVRNSGSILIDKIYLDLDFGYQSSLAEVNFKKQVVQEPLIAPWSHRWSGYYDYLIFVVAKLCRIEKALEKIVWQDSLVYYPWLNSKFEQQILNHFDLAKDQFYRLPPKTDLKVAGSLIVGNNQKWYYPSPGDISLLRNKFLPREFNYPNPDIKIYIERKGRRGILNNNEVKRLIESFDIKTVILEDLTFDEQIQLFKDAGLIIGPHGAGFTNILWSAPGAHVIELFGQGYFPPYFYYLSRILDLKYDCIVETGSARENYKNLNNQITVDLKYLEKLLNQIHKHPINSKTLHSHPIA